MKFPQPHPKSHTTIPAFDLSFRLKKKNLLINEIHKGLKKQENSFDSIEPMKANSRHICIESNALINFTYSLSYFVFLIQFREYRKPERISAKFCAPLHMPMSKNQKIKTL